MIKIWHYHGKDDWTPQALDFHPEVTYQEILKSMDIPTEPSLVLGNSDNFVAIFRNNQDKYVCDLDIQDIHQLVVIDGFPHLLSFLEKITTLLISLADIEDAFGSTD